VIFDTFQAVPKSDATAEQDRNLHDMEAVDEVGGKEVTDRRWTTADTDVAVAGRLTIEREYLLGLASTK
jgi:hypothetical protein